MWIVNFAKEGLDDCDISGSTLLRVHEIVSYRVGNGDENLCTQVSAEVDRLAIGKFWRFHSLQCIVGLFWVQHQSLPKHLCCTPKSSLKRAIQTSRHLQERAAGHLLCGKSGICMIPHTIADESCAKEHWSQGHYWAQGRSWPSSTLEWLLDCMPDHTTLHHEPLLPYYRL